MQEARNGFANELREVVTQMIGRYVPGLLTEDWLPEQFKQTWLLFAAEEELSDGRRLEFLARGLCSQVLCDACLCSDPTRQNLGFEGLQGYLREILVRVSGGTEFGAEVLQQTLLEIWLVLHKRGGGPHQPAAFLKWARVILFRQLSRYLEHAREKAWLSLDAQSEAVLEELVDNNETDPIDAILRSELHMELQEAIQALKNSQYRQVLLHTYFADIEEHELAAHWQVQVQNIYLWRYRALRALRKQMVDREKLRKPA